MQEEIGSCDESRIAFGVAVPVVKKFPERHEIIVHGGGVHLSKDRLVTSEGKEIYGKIALPVENGWGKSVPGCYLRSLSQEHGVVQCTNELMNSVNEGDILIILPIHSCLTADCMKDFFLAGSIGNPEIFHTMNSSAEF